MTKNIECYKRHKAFEKVIHDTTQSDEWWGNWIENESIDRLMLYVGWMVSWIRMNDDE